MSHTHPDTKKDDLEAPEIAPLQGLRIGFLYNHDELHQVAHTAPIISELQRAAPFLDINILTSSDAQAAAVEPHLDPALPRPEFHALASNRLAETIERITGGFIPLRRIGSLANNKTLLSRFDALVVPETTTTLLKTHYKLELPKLIHIPHGAGDRSIAVSPDIRHFDFVMLPGEKTRDRMLDAGVVRPDNNAIVGYPKFDSRQLARPKKFFDDDRPVVLYNPHFDPKLSSWFVFGEQLMDYFATQDQFNLIVAPHVMLFRRKVLASVEHRQIRLRKSIPKRFLNDPHIHIDTGSLNSVDMSYTRTADYYIGDVSSQIYEFIERPRPAIFLNSHEADWQVDPSYTFWKFGPVANSFATFKALWEGGDMHDPRYLDVQAETFRNAIAIDAEHSSAYRAAHAIIGYLSHAFTGANSRNRHD